MQPQIAIPTLLCTQCGGELHPDEGQFFLTCPYCGSTVYVDRSQVVFHWYLAPTLKEAEARSSLARWMASSQTVKDLDKKASLVSGTFEYFPVWYFKFTQPGGKEEILLEPAAATAISELKQIKLMAGDLRKYDQSVEKQSRTPSVPLESATAWANQRRGAQGQITERALVHIPLFTFKYSFKKQIYTALVECGTGSVFANIYPAKAEAPYLLAGAAAFLTFGFLALIPVIAYAANDASGLGIGLLVCSALGVVAAPVLFAVAAWVAAKI